MGLYDSIVGPGASFAGVDQGIDFTGSFDILAPADAIVTRVQRSGSGWPGQGAVVNLRLLSGPSAGRYVYVAEDLVPNVRIGQHVQKGAVIGRATGSGQAPGIEYGWAQPSGIPLAPRPAPRPAPQYTPQGADFEKFAQGTGGGGGIVGTVDRVAGGLAAAANPVAAVVGGGVSAVGGIGSAVSGTVGAAEGTAKFFSHLTDPHYILRGLQVIAGSVLVLVGIVLLARQVGLAVAQSETGQAVTKTAEAVATRGGSIAKDASSTSGRRRGNAAANRGESVTRTGTPRRSTRSERTQLRRSGLARQREINAQAARQDAEYGDVPF